MQHFKENWRCTCDKHWSRWWGRKLCKKIEKWFRKYKGSFPPELFNCGKMDHYVVRWSFKEDNYKRLGGDKINDSYRRYDWNSKIDDWDKGRKGIYFFKTH